MGLEDLKKSFDGAITAAANAASDATSTAKKSIQSIDTVSYTHLDVYKRQAFNRKGGDGANKRALSTYNCI